MVTVTAMGWAVHYIYYTLYYYKLPPFNTIILLSSPCTLLYFLTFLSNWNPQKVSYIQNELMRSSFLQKSQPKITDISALEVY